MTLSELPLFNQITQCRLRFNPATAEAIWLPEIGEAAL
jgi:hypothetical protein